MNYFAILNPNSAISRRWREHSRIGGIIDHVQFYWRMKQFESDMLSAEEMERLRIRQAGDIRIQAMGVIPDVVVNGEEVQQTSEEEDDKLKKPRTRQRL